MKEQPKQEELIKISICESYERCFSLRRAFLALIHVLVLFGGTPNMVLSMSMAGVALCLTTLSIRLRINMLVAALAHFMVAFSVLIWLSLGGPILVAQKYYRPPDKMYYREKIHSLETAVNARDSYEGTDAHSAEIICRVW